MEHDHSVMPLGGIAQTSRPRNDASARGRLDVTTMWRCLREGCLEGSDPSATPPQGMFRRSRPPRGPSSWGWRLVQTGKTPLAKGDAIGQDVLVEAEE
jgi:hypothetical protein